MTSRSLMLTEGFCILCNILCLRHAIGSKGTRGSILLRFRSMASDRFVRLPQHCTQRISVDLSSCPTPQVKYYTLNIGKLTTNTMKEGSAGVTDGVMKCLIRSLEIRPHVSICRMPYRGDSGCASKPATISSPLSHETRRCRFQLTVSDGRAR